MKFTYMVPHNIPLSPISSKTEKKCIQTEKWNTAHGSLNQQRHTQKIQFNSCFIGLSGTKLGRITTFPRMKNVLPMPSPL